MTQTQIEWFCLNDKRQHREALFFAVVRPVSAHSNGRKTQIRPAAGRV